MEETLVYKEFMDTLQLVILAGNVHFAIDKVD
jgi:hypothetical protein